MTRRILGGSAAAGKSRAKLAAVAMALLAALAAFRLPAVGVAVGTFAAVIAVSDALLRTRDRDE